MDFHVDTADSLAITDLEISELLLQVYVDGGFVELESTTALFEPSAVRSRGKMLAARAVQNSILAGMIIIVHPHSSVCRLAKANETEMHLLAVKPEYRGNGLGRMLIAAAIDDAIQGGFSKMLLSTQSTMKTAHYLYEFARFVRVPERDYHRGGRDFLVYEKILNTYRSGH